MPGIDIGARAFLAMDGNDISDHFHDVDLDPDTDVKDKTTFAPDRVAYDFLQGLDGGTGKITGFSDLEWELITNYCKILLRSAPQGSYYTIAPGGAAVGNVVAMFKAIGTKEAHKLMAGEIPSLELGFTISRGSPGLLAGVVLQCPSGTTAISADELVALVAAGATGNAVFTVAAEDGTVLGTFTVHPGDSTSTVATAIEAVPGIISATVTGSAPKTSGTAKVFTVTLASATGAGTLEGIVATPGETAATLQAALRGLGGLYADVVVSANVPALSSGTGKVFRLTAAAVTGAATLGGSETVTPGDLAATVQASVRDLGGAFAAATVTDASDPGVPSLTPVNLATVGNGTPSADQGTAANAFAGGAGGFALYSGPTSQPWKSGGFLEWDFGAGNAQIITKLTVALNNTDFQHGYLLGSNTGAFAGEEILLLSSVTSGTSHAYDQTFTNTTAFRYYLFVADTSGDSGAHAVITELDLYGGGSGSVSGYYDIALPVSAGDAAAPSLSGGWTIPVHTAYVAPIASGAFNLTFSVADGNVTTPTLTGTGWSIATATAYVSPTATGTYYADITGPDDTAFSITHASGAGWSALEGQRGGITRAIYNPQTETFDGTPVMDIAHDKTSVNGLEFDLQELAAQGAGFTATYALQHSADDGSGNATTWNAVGDAVTVTGKSPNRMRVAAGVTIYPHLRLACTAITGLSLPFCSVCRH